MARGAGYLSLFVFRGHALALQDGILAIQKKITEAFDPVALPVLYECFELLDGLHTFFSGNGIIGTGED
jgi:hypothetical protein